MFRTFVNLFERLTRSHNSARKAKRLHNFNGLETLEDRSVPSASVSGFVYTDNNNNGIMDAGDTGVPGATVLLNNSAGTTVSTATTDPTGAYQFTLPDTPSAPGSSTVTATLNLQSLTSAPASATVAQFNPALGQLTSVEIVDNSSLNSSIKVENGSSSADTMTVQVMGDLMLQGDGLPSPIDLTFTPPGDTAVVTGDPNAGPLGSASNPINFSGVNSHDFGTRTLTGSRSIVLDGGTTDLSAFEGTGDVNLSLSGQGFTGLTAGSDGILQYGTSAQANVEIIYHYQPPDTFTDGWYTIVQPGDPAAPYTAGQLTAGNVTPIPNSYGYDGIAVTLNNGDHPTGYNFGQVPPGSISGFVYSDANDNGVKESNEAPVAGVQVTLTGTNDLGQQVTLSQASGADGSYNFADLRSGTYTVTRGAVPAGFIDGKNTPGTPGNGQVLGNSITSITVQPSVSDPNNNFGLVQPGSLAGFVYYDQYSAGWMVPGDPGIANVLVTLTGENDLGVMINQPIQTAADGSYSFGPLRPGIYQITETPPAGYLPGTNNLGTLYGTLTGDTFGVYVQSGNQGQNYNFGNVLPPPPVVPPPPPPVVPPPPPVVPPPPPIMPPPPPVVPPPPPPMLPPPPPPVVPPPPPPQDLIPQSPPPPPPQIPASKRTLTGNAWLSWDW